MALKDNKSPLVNEKIRVDRLQLITHDGQNIGVVSRNEALQRAREADLDLVLISEQGGEGFPVAKILDFGKILYSKKKKATEAKKKQKVIKIKEIKIRPKIGEHDLQIKLKQCIQFLAEGKRVKFTLNFKGREAATKNEVGPALFNKVDSAFKDAALKNLENEPDSKMGSTWSRIYYLKGN